LQRLGDVYGFYLQIYLFGVLAYVNDVIKLMAPSAAAMRRRYKYAASGVASIYLPPGAGFIFAAPSSKVLVKWGVP